MSHTQRLKDLAVSESGFVFDPHTGNTYNTNGSGKIILDGLAAGLDRKAIIELLEEAFEIEGDDLDRDLDEFIYLLREDGILPSGFTL